MRKILILTLALLTFGALLTFTSNASAKNSNVKLRVFEHFPKGKPAITSNCTVTTNDKVNDYGSAGWQMPVGGLDYKINYSSEPKNLSNAALQNAVTNSFATWSAADPKQIFKYTGATSAKTAKFDGTNEILFKPITSSAIAITYIWYYPSTGQLVESDTVFNKNYKWSVNTSTSDCVNTLSYDVQNIGTHEFGHWIGLDDLYNAADKDLTMYGYGELGELKKDTLGKGDITGVNTILP